MYGVVCAIECLLRKTDEETNQRGKPKQAKQ